MCAATFGPGPGPERECSSRGSWPGQVAGTSGPGGWRAAAAAAALGSRSRATAPGRRRRTCIMRSATRQTRCAASTPPHASGAPPTAMKPSPMVSTLYTPCGAGRGGGPAVAAQGRQQLALAPAARAEAGTARPGCLQPLTRPPPAAQLPRPGGARSSQAGGGPTAGKAGKAGRQAGRRRAHLFQADGVVNAAGRFGSRCVAGVSSWLAAAGNRARCSSRTAGSSRAAAAPVQPPLPPPHLYTWLSILTISYGVTSEASVGKEQMSLNRMVTCARGAGRAGAGQGGDGGSPATGLAAGSQRRPPSQPGQGRAGQGRAGQGRAGQRPPAAPAAPREP
jgi:hypothetical protein